MNAYTVDPIGREPEATAASALSSNYQYQQFPAHEIHNIRDWLPWSIINIFLGGIPIGFLPLIFSLLCRSRKRKNDPNSARTMSTLAFVFNIIIIVLAAFGLGCLTYYLIYSRRILNLT